MRSRSTRSTAWAAMRSRASSPEWLTRAVKPRASSRTWIMRAIPTSSSTTRMVDRDPAVIVVIAEMSFQDREPPSWRPCGHGDGSWQAHESSGRRRRLRDREEERGAPADHALDPDPPPVLLDHGLADGEAEPGPLHLRPRR